MTWAQWRTVGLHAGTFVGGVAAAISAMAASGFDLYAAYQHAYAGIKELTLAWAILGPALLVGYAAYKAAPGQKIKDIVTAAKDNPINTAALVAAVDKLPDVAGIITKATETGKALAQAIPSSTVVSIR